ncbi:MAG: hypothetical protein KAU21_10550, partial [Gammaproteobacteria bacterium]|nr:hypothetical protein [Gammaproteobacteria bacterium]
MLTEAEEDEALTDFPDCAGPNYFNDSALVCDHANVAYDDAGTRDPSSLGPLGLVGTYSDQLAYYDTTANRWLELGEITSSSERDFKVECLSDSGNHGAATGGQDDFIKDGGPYTSTEPANLDVPHPVWASGAGNKQLFSGNYLNYNLWEPVDNIADPSVDELVSVSYIDQVKAAVNIMVRGNTRVNIGLMRFDRMSAGGNSGDSEGGPVLYPIIDVGESRSDFFSRLATLDSDGFSPMSEAYYEALLYYGGKATDYSADSSPSNQIVATTLEDGHFRSPISSTCDKNYIVVLSSGNPTLDVVNSTRQAVLPGFTGTCSTNITTVQVPGNGTATRDAYNAVDNCLDELSAWAATEDVATDPAKTAHVGEQNIFTHTIGLGINANYVAPELTASTVLP